VNLGRRVALRLGRPSAGLRMATLLQIAGFLLFLVLWGAAWRKQPHLALGIFLGVAIAAAVAVFVRPFDLHNMPVWLPALPFAVVAICLFCFGVWAWFLGSDR
jgi:hypothetical protein